MYINIDDESKLNNLKYILKSILNQNYIQINNIIIIVQHKSKYELPIIYKDYVKIQYINDNYCNKCRGLIQSLLETVDEDSINIITDGSFIFGKDFLIETIFKTEKHRDSIFFMDKKNKTKCIIYKPNQFNYNLDYRKINKKNIHKFYNKNVKQRVFKNYEHNFELSSEM